MIKMAQNLLSKAKQSKAKQSKAKQSKAKLNCAIFVPCDRDVCETEYYIRDG